METPETEDAHVNGGAAAQPTPEPAVDAPAPTDKTVDPSPAVADAVKDTLGEAARQAAAVTQMRMAQARAMAAQQRLQIATVLCGGICAGYYTDPSKFVAGFGDTVTDKALEWADQLIAKAAKLPAAANG